MRNPGSGSVLASIQSRNGLARQSEHRRLVAQSDDVTIGLNHLVCATRPYDHQARNSSRLVISFPRSVPSRPNEAGRIIRELMDLMLRCSRLTASRQTQRRERRRARCQNPNTIRRRAEPDHRLEDFPRTAEEFVQGSLANKDYLDELLFGIEKDYCQRLLREKADLSARFAIARGLPLTSCGRSSRKATALEAIYQEV